MRRFVFALSLVFALTSLSTAMAQSGMEMGGGMGMGTGMSMGIVVADDGTVLTIDRGDDSAESHSGAVIAIGSNGVIKWRTAFDEAAPMMFVTNGDLVVAIVGSGDMMDDDDHGGGMGGGMGGDEGSEHSIRLAGLALGNGSSRWSTDLEDLMPMGMTFSPDGSVLYVEAAEMSMSDDDHHGGGEGDDHMGEARLLAFGRDGHLLWSIELGSSSSAQANRRMAASHVQ